MKRDAFAEFLAPPEDEAVDGGDDVLIAGRPRNIYPDQPLTVVE